MRSLIIGGAGFVGAYLARDLLKAGHEVSVTKMVQEQADIPGTLVYDLDILDKKAVFDLLDQTEPDYIFHLAAQSSVAVSWNNPQLTVGVNITGSVNVLEAVRRLDKKPRILLVGSGEEYGMVLPDEIPIRETVGLNPVNIYAATKACQNMTGRIYAQAYGLDVIMVRAFNHIGPNQAPLFVAADFCRQAAEIEAGKKEPVIKAGNLSVRRDFTDVRDVVRAYTLLAGKGQAGETYNVGSGHAAAIGDILRIVLEKTAVQIRIEADAQKMRPADMPVMEADIHKLQEITGWYPKISLEQTIQETLDYWRAIV